MVNIALSINQEPPQGARIEDVNLVIGTTVIRSSEVIENKMRKFSEWCVEFSEYAKINNIQNNIQIHPDSSISITGNSKKIYNFQVSGNIGCYHCDYTLLEIEDFLVSLGGIRLGNKKEGLCGNRELVFLLWVLFSPGLFRIMPKDFVALSDDSLFISIFSDKIIYHNIGCPIFPQFRLE